MIVDHLALLILVIALGGVLLVVLLVRRGTSPGRSTGPNTLEELFAARFARGDIDESQYLSSVGHIAERLRG